MLLHYVTVLRHAQLRNVNYQLSRASFRRVSLRSLHPLPSLPRTHRLVDQLDRTRAPLVEDGGNHRHGEVPRAGRQLRVKTHLKDANGFTNALCNLPSFLELDIPYRMPHLANAALKKPSGTDEHT